MNTVSASPGDRAGSPAPSRDAPATAPSVLVWDAPVRVFHATTILAFAGAWVTAESERWQLVHISLGWMLAALVMLRIVWGFAGTRHARFADFVHGPSAAWGYVRSLFGRRPQHHVGHNPAGALAIVGLLGLALAVAGSGWATFHDIGGDVVEDVHEVLAHAMLLLVGVHVAGVLVGSVVHRENLIASMIHGRKRAPASDGIPRARWPFAALLLVAAIGVGTWAYGSYRAAPRGDGVAVSTGASGSGPGMAAEGKRERGKRRDDDRPRH